MSQGSGCSLSPRGLQEEPLECRREKGIGSQEGQLGGISRGNRETSKDGAEASFPMY